MKSRFKEDPDKGFMKEALKEARKGFGRTSPNPAVGSVVVKEGHVISRGFHRAAGLPHAEAEALRRAGADAEGGTLYVTLEPCNHQGRTPPCTEAVFRSGVKRVVVGMLDPNPSVAGGGCELLEQRGLEVRTGVLEKECRNLNEAFVTFVTRGRPFVAWKSAMTLDGWTATATGDAKWITNEKSRRFVHRLRDRMDAVLVGVGTVIADDPRLTARLGRKKGKDPLRIILDTHLRTPRDARVVHRENDPERTLIIAGPDVSRESLRRLTDLGISARICPAGGDGIDLPALMDILVKMSVTSILLEGGGAVVGSMLRHRMVDKCYIFKAPKILGGYDGKAAVSGRGPENISGCPRLKDVAVRRFDEDTLITGYPEYPETWPRTLSGSPAGKGRPFTGHF